MLFCLILTNCVPKAETALPCSPSIPSPSIYATTCSIPPTLLDPRVSYFLNAL